MAGPTEAAGTGSDATDLWADALAAAHVLAVDPAALGGLLLRAGAGPVRDAWLDLVQQLLPPGTPWRRMPVSIADDRLLGGLDLAATLRSGQPQFTRGLLAEVDAGVLVLPMAERVPNATAARIAAALDAREVQLERDGLAQRMATRFGVVALDESEGDEERPPHVLVDRLAIILDLRALPRAVAQAEVLADIGAARARLATVDVPDALLDALCGGAAAFGIGSLRVPLMALAVTRASAALAGRAEASEEDVQLAARLVLAARAVQLPADETQEEQPPESQQEEQQAEPPQSRDEQERTQTLPDEMVVAAALAAIPADLLLRLKAARHRARQPTQGRAGQMRQSHQRGRPAGTRRGPLLAGMRLDVIETLRAAAPWQPLRRRERGVVQGAPRVDVRRDDFRIVKRKQPSQTTTVFVVDASGSSALHRLSEAKGAVELLLAQCYVRRDRVALVAFRGQGAQLLLPPTRSLTRAKRSLAQLPGGGGTPLAAGLEAAYALIDGLRRRGETTVLVVMTDGRANVARDGAHGREQADADARAAARRLRACGALGVLVDTSPRPHAAARALAAEMDALYLPLPHADALQLSQALAATGVK
jgi:magnesium chelatase subunit D